MSARTWVLAACVAAACGRSGFSELPDAAAPDAPADAATLPANVVATHVPAFSTASPTFVTATSVTLPPSTGRTWIVFFTGALESTTFADVGAEVRYLVAGVERGYGGTQSSAPGRPGPWQHFYVVTGGATETPIDVQARDAAGGTTTLTDLRVVALELPAGTDVHYASDDPIKMISNNTFQATSTFSLPVAAGHDYIVFALVNASDAPGESDVYIQWRDGSGTLHLPDTQQPRTCWQAMLTAWTESVTASPLVVTLEAKVGFQMSQLQDARVVAIPASAFTGVDVQTSPAPAMTTSTTPSTVDTMLPGTLTGSAFFYLASLRMAEDCAGNPSFADRTAHFSVDGLERGSIMHRAANCAYQSTYGTIGVTTTPPANLSTWISSGNALNVIGDESAIVLLGMP